MTDECCAMQMAVIPHPVQIPFLEKAGKLAGILRAMLFPVGTYKQTAAE
jgi:hypothetical protein